VGLVEKEKLALRGKTAVKMAETVHKVQRSSHQQSVDQHGTRGHGAVNDILWLASICDC